MTFEKRVYEGWNKDRRVGTYWYFINLKNNRVKIGFASSIAKRMTGYVGCFSGEPFEYLTFGPINGAPRDKENTILKEVHSKYRNYGKEYFYADPVEAENLFRELAMNSI